MSQKLYKTKELPTMLEGDVLRILSKRVEELNDPADPSYLVVNRNIGRVSDPTLYSIDGLKSICELTEETWGEIERLDNLEGVMVNEEFFILRV